MSWNAVMNMFTEIKKSVINIGMDLWNYNKSEETCLEYWVRALNIDKYTDLIKYLICNEYGDLLLIRYADYARIFRGEIENEKITFENFWDVYDGFYRECRSVVINIHKDELVLTPFRKFRNLNECEETSYENIKARIEKAKCVEFSNKLDGSMQSARYYDGEYVMAGSQAIDKNNSWRLADGYRMLGENDAYLKMLKENPRETFIFEYISKNDAHVVKYDVEGLFLIGVRNVDTGIEASYSEVIEYANRYGVLVTEKFDKTLEQVVSELDDKQSSEAEGFVMNVDGFKVKIKYNDYVYMHKMLSAISSVNVIIQSIADDNFDDVIAKVPDSYKERVLSIAKCVFDYKTKTEKAIEDAFSQAPKDDKVTFMIWVNKNVNKKHQSFVRCKYLGNSFNVLKSGNGAYIKLKDMGVEINKYGDLFEK